MAGRKHTIPESLRAALKDIGDAPLGSRVDDALLERTLAGIDTLDPRHVPEAEQTFANLADLHSVYWIDTPSFLPARLATWLFESSPKLSRRPFQEQPGRLRSARRDGAPDIAMLTQQPGLAAIFMRHRNGYVREAALNALGPASLSPFVFASLAYRLNDWVAPVRAAAAAALARVVPQMPVAAIAEAAPFLIANSSEWGRWSGYNQILDSLLERQEIALALADRLVAPSSGGELALLRRLMRRRAIDPILPKLAAEARAPAIRALASEALIVGAAKWPGGFREYWVDKSVGRKGYERLFETRPLTIATDCGAALHAAANDRSAVVRKVAADAVVRGFADGNAADSVVARLKDDLNPGVRDRIAFVIRQRAALA